MADFSFTVKPSGTISLQSRCSVLRTLLLKREELLYVLLSLPEGRSRCVAEQQLAECATLALKAADDVLGAPIKGLTDLQEKLSAVLLLEPFYADDPSLAATLLHQVCVDVQNVASIDPELGVLAPKLGDSPHAGGSQDLFRAAPLKTAN